MEVGVNAPNAEQVIAADVTVVSQYENLVVPVKASVAHGTLEIVPKPVVIDDCFPVRTPLLFYQRRIFFDFLYFLLG